MGSWPLSRLDCGMRNSRTRNLPVLPVYGILSATIIIGSKNRSGTPIPNSVYSREVVVGLLVERRDMALRSKLPKMRLRHYFFWLRQSINFFILVIRGRRYYVKNRTHASLLPSSFHVKNVTSKIDVLLQVAIFPNPFLSTNYQLATMAK